MASNQKRIHRRIINPDTRQYEFGIFEAKGFGDRQLVAIVEGTVDDAKDLLKSERTESGNTFKGFKKLKA